MRPRGRTPTYDTKRQHEIVKIYLETDITLAQLAKQYGISTTTVLSYVAKYKQQLAASSSS